MKKPYYFLFCFIVLNSFIYAQDDCNTQIEYIEVESEILNTKRQLKIQKPRNYDANPDKTYPLIFVFDADYLFEPVAGNVDFLSHWDEIPEAFVIGVNQSETRMDDGVYDKENFSPSRTGARFFDFIQVDIMPYLRENYRIGSFSVAVGHNYMANFMNLFLFTDKPLFQGYINLSPDIPEGFMPYIKDRLETIKQKTWYSLATGSKDIEYLKTKTDTFYENLSNIGNVNLSLSYTSAEGGNHYSLVTYALPYCITSIFEPYTPIDEAEYQNKLIKANDPVVYLKKKYDLIKELYGLEEAIRIGDVMQVYNLIAKQERWELCYELARIARDEFPASVLYNYFIGKYYQGVGEPRKAYNAYRAGYVYNEAGGITKDMLIEEADLLKEAFGY
jgi:predicted alpha/beta superfamily hydrolase